MIITPKDVFKETLAPIWECSEKRDDYIALALEMGLIAVLTTILMGFTWVTLPLWLPFYILGRYASELYDHEKEKADD